MRREFQVRFCEGLGVRFPRATRLVVGFQHREEAEQFWRDMAQRLSEFALELHPDKTRLLEFGRFAAQRRTRKGLGKPETFDFLGFTHICGKSRAGRYLVKRQTSRKRLVAKLVQVKEVLMRHRHKPIPEQGAWLRSVVRGYFNYHAVPPCFAGEVSLGNRTHLATGATASKPEA